MKNRKRIVSLLAGLMAAIMLMTLILSLMPATAYASSSEIRNQINALKKEKEELKGKISEVKDQYQANEDEISDIIARKNVIEQEVQLLVEQITNINDQIAAYNILIADKQDELDNAEGRYEQLNDANRVRVRTMEEEGELTYWEVLFKANSFSDLLDRLNMVEEIASADKRRIQALSDAKDAVGEAQNALNGEKAELEATKAELDQTELELADKQEEALAIFQELLSKGDELDALREEYEAQEQEFLKQIAQKEKEFTAAKQAEWEAWIATSIPPTTGGVAGSDGSNNGQGGGTTGNGGGQPSIPSGGAWLIPTSYSSITSPFGPRKAPTAGASTNHLGVDLDSTTGTPVVATRAGVVTTSTYGSAAGNYIEIDHRDGYVSIYMHLDRRDVSVGAIVSAGQQIGTVGATGSAVTGDHLHFGIRKNGVYINPASVVPLH